MPINGQLVGQGTSIATLVGWLSRELGGRTILDKTGLTGNYDFTLRLPAAKDGQQTTANASSSASSGPPLFNAVQENLGLKLEPQTAPMEVLVIDHAEKPPEK